MKFALVNGLLQEAQPNSNGTCPVCNHPTVARCGDVYVHHWGHKVGRMCDHWWENETPWHRNWKNQFPKEWQEFIHRCEISGKKHIADVKTAEGWAIEFQNSFLKPEERQARDAFYKKVVWVVNGKRRPTDMKQFVETLNRGIPVGNNSVVWKVYTPKCRLLREWCDSSAPVFFDFGEPRIWWLFPKSPNGQRNYIGVFPRDQFVHIHRGGTDQIKVFESFLQEWSGLVSKYEAHVQASRDQRPLPAFQQYLERSRRRL